MKKSVPKHYFNLLTEVKRYGGLSAYRQADKNTLKIKTYYPGCDVCISAVDQEWSIDVTNRDPSKISNQMISAIFRDCLKNYSASTFKLKESRIYDFLSESVCLENWRDIFTGRVDELLCDENQAYTEAKIGAFGFLKGQTKPERLNFVDLASRHPTCFHYVETQKFSEQDSLELTLIDYKKRFKYIIDLPGHTYSTKLYWMLFLKRPLFLVQPKLSFEWERKLIPWVHYIPVNDDLSNLMTRFEWAESNPKKVEEMRLCLFEWACSELSPEMFRAKFEHFLKDSLVRI